MQEFIPLIIFSLIQVILGVSWFVVGRWSVTTKRHENEPSSETIDTIVEAVHPTKIISHPRAGVIPFKQAEEFTKEAQEDTELEKEWIASGIAEEIQRE